MRESSLYTAVNLAMGGTLRASIAEMRTAGRTFDEIASIVGMRTGVPVSREWVRKQLKVHEAAA